MPRRNGTTYARTYGPRGRSSLSYLAPTLLAIALAVMSRTLGWEGVDYAAQTYRVDSFSAHGFVLWDPSWYAGNLPFGYSVLFPAVGAVVGIGAAAVLSAAVATFCFDRITTRLFGDRPWGVWIFSVSMLLPVAIGQLTYLSGAAVASAAILSLVAALVPAPDARKNIERWLLWAGAVVLGIVSALLSPLAAAFLVLVAILFATRAKGLRAASFALCVVTSVVVVLLGLTFPAIGTFPFSFLNLVEVEILCVGLLLPWVGAHPTVRAGAALYGLASLVSFVVPSAVGGDAFRLLETLGVPLVACYLLRPRDGHRSLDDDSKTQGLKDSERNSLGSALGARANPLVALLLLPLLVFQWIPISTVVGLADSDPAARPSFYRPLLAQLDSKDSRGLQRVEVVPELHHWESVYIASRFPLARGWERQLDIGYNPIFYDSGVLTPARYRRWLLNTGVTWVALPNAPLDYAGTAEATLLRSNRIEGLDLVWSDKDWRLWRVRRSPGLVSGPGSLLSMGPDRVVLDIKGAGRLLVRIHYTEVLSPTQPWACTERAGGGWTAVESRRTGRLSLQAGLGSTDFLPVTRAGCGH